MDTQATITHPLRPMLLVISGSEYEGASLAEQVARTYAGHKQRLTEKFSKRHWDIPVISLTDKDAMERAWRGMEEVQMAILTGYDGSAAHRQTLQSLQQAANPVSVLLSDETHQPDPVPFSKSISLLPGTLAEHFLTANKAMKDARHENAYKAEFPGEKPAGRRDYLQ